MKIVLVLRFDHVYRDVKSNNTTRVYKKRAPMSIHVVAFFLSEVVGFCLRVSCLACIQDAFKTNISSLAINAI